MAPPKHCQRCGASLADVLNAPVSWALGLCVWCEHQWHMMKREDELVLLNEGRGLDPEDLG